MQNKSKSGPPGADDGESRGGQTPALTQQQQQVDHRIAASYDHLSRQVAWWPVHDYINRQRRHFVAQEVSAPPLGTPAWCSLPDDHPAKLSAVLNAAEAMAYSISAGQVAEAAAARVISAGADWTAIARAIRQRADFYAERPYLRRVVA